MNWWTKAFRSDVARAIRWFRGGLTWEEPRIKIRPTPRMLAEFLFSHPRGLVVDVETEILAQHGVLFRGAEWQEGGDGVAREESHDHGDAKRDEDQHDDDSSKLFGNSPEFPHGAHSCWRVAEKQIKKRQRCGGLHHRTFVRLAVPLRRDS